jgi:hypothetical protein
MRKVISLKKIKESKINENPIFALKKKIKIDA